MNSAAEPSVNCPSGSSPAFRQLPETVIVELTNHCNLRCPLCTTHTAMSRARGYMDFDLFRRILEDAEAASWKPRISMNMCGEPLLHEEADRFVHEASQRGFSTFISTNCTRLSVSMSEKLIDAGLDSIALCIDGASARAHEPYRVGSDFEEIRENCRRFLSVLRRLDAARPRVTVQTLITALSEHELPEIAAWARQIGADEVFFKFLSLGSSASGERSGRHSAFLPADPRLQRRLASPDAACPMPARHVIVYWDGKLGFCCVDFNNDASLPDVRNGSLTELLSHPSVISARTAAHWKLRPLCKRCQSPGENCRGFGIALNAFRQGPIADRCVPDWAALIEARIRETLPL